MRNLVCIRHRDYDGKEPPVLSCKTCCKLYIDLIREDHKKGQLKKEKVKVKNSKRRGLAGNEK